MRGSGGERKGGTQGCIKILWRLIGRHCQRTDRIFTVCQAAPNCRILAAGMLEKPPTTDPGFMDSPLVTRRADA